MDQMTYAGVGVNYDSMDPFKRLAQKHAKETSENIARFGFKEFAESRGESVYLIETEDSYLAHVEEGLGTKNMVADDMYKLTGKSYYDQIAQCTVAMIVNDMITLGALPISLAMHLAAGASEWFEDEKKIQDLVLGWKKACDLSRCVWGGGETPTLKGMVNEETVILAGSAMGMVKPKDRLIKGNVQDGDAIILFESSGIHANGLTLARKIGEKLPDGYLTKLSDGRTYGESLLDPTHIYVGIIDDCLNEGIDIHYTVNVTGHGWRKLMRLTEPFVYIVDEILDPHPLFPFIQEHGPMDDNEAYGNLNMGVGFAIYVPESDVQKVLEISEKNNIKAIRGGHVEKQGDNKKVIIQPKNLEYEGESLGVR